jgi:protein TonB
MGKFAFLTLLGMVLWLSPQWSFAQQEEEVLVNVEVNPTPNGGFAGLYKFIGANMRYPNPHNASGKVFVRFIVEKNGQTTNHQIIKGLGPAYDNEAIRLLKSAPAWEPGKQNGKPVRVQCTLPITFKSS